jgi:ADP-heptose:LPS heptosyltransferase
MITADCGVMHLAVASCVPTVGMFCVTDASVYAPYGRGNSSLPTQGLTAREVACRVVAAHPDLLGRPVLAAPAELSRFTDDNSLLLSQAWAP